MKVKISAVLNVCLFFSFVVGKPSTGPPSTGHLSSRDSFLKLMGNQQFVIHGAASPTKTFPNARARLLTGSETGNDFKVYIMEPTKKNNKFPTIKVAINYIAGQYRVHTNPDTVDPHRHQKMIYLPAYQDSITCTELPNYKTQQWVPTGVPKDLVLTDGLSGCSAFIVRLDPKATTTNIRAYRRDYFCHMNSKNGCGDRYVNGKIRRSILAARFIPESEGGSDEYNSPKVILKVEGQGVDYQSLNNAFLVAHNNAVGELNGRWMLKFQVHLGEQTVAVVDKGV